MTRNTPPAPAGHSVSEAEGNPAMNRFSTLDFPSSLQFEAWREKNVNMPLRLTPSALPRDGFDAEMTVYELGRLTFSSEKFDPVELELHREDLRKGKADHWMLCLFKTGFTHYWDGERLVPSPPETLKLRSLAQPLRACTTRVEAAFVHIPRNLFPERSSAYDALHKQALNDGLSTLLRDLLLEVESGLPSLSPDGYRALDRVLQNMIACCLTPTSGSLEAARPELSATLLGRIRRHIRENVRSKTLSPEELCRVFGMSPMQLRHLFDPHGGVVSEIWAQRLIASHTALTNAHDRRRINEIAEDFGFTSTDGFARAFRQRFGYTPRDARFLRIDAAFHKLPDLRGNLNDWLRKLERTRSN